MRINDETVGMRINDNSRAAKTDGWTIGEEARRSANQHINHVTRHRLQSHDSVKMHEVAENCS